jgi:hypothetical protein
VARNKWKSSPKAPDGRTPGKQNQARALRVSPSFDPVVSGRQDDHVPGFARTEARPRRPRRLGPLMMYTDLVTIAQSRTSGRAGQPQRGLSL